MAEPLLEVKNLQVTYGSGRKAYPAVQNASFTIYKGETFGLVGESGSGKTTIGRAILRILPTTALDVTIQAQILQLLKEMQVKYNLTIVLITHDLGVVANIADRVAVMYAGDIIEIGTSDEIYYDPRHPYTWALLSSMPQMGIKGEDLFNIQGTPPNLFTEIHGDAFAPRNPQALKIDFVKRPPYFEISPTHKAKTWLLDPRAPKVEPPLAVRLLKEEGM